MHKKFSLTLGLVLASLAGASWCRADYSNTVMSFNPVAYWPLNETNQPPLAPTTATNIGTLGVAGNGTYAGPCFAITSPIAGDTNQAVSLSAASVTLPYSAPLTLQAPFSAEGWFNPDDDGATEACMSLGELAAC